MVTTSAASAVATGTVTATITAASVCITLDETK